MYPKTLIGDYVTLYGICIAIGVLICIFMVRYFGKRYNVNQKFMDFCEILAYCAIAVGFLTSWLFQTFYDYIENGVWNWKQTGITFIGGLIGGVGTFLIVYALMRKKLTGRAADIIPFAPCCITIAHAFGRVGCFFAGCCGGKVAQPDDFLYFLSVKFYGDSYRTYPIQLFEAIFLFALTGIMVYLLLKKNFKYNFVVYLASYGVWRYLIEFARGDERGQIIKGVDWLSPSQFWSIIMILLTVPVYYLIKYLINKRNKEKEELANSQVVETAK